MKFAIVSVGIVGAALAGSPKEASAQTDLLRWRGVLQDDTYGWAIGPAGDVDGDGTGDVLVGSPDDDTNGTDAGRVRVLSGRDGTVLRELLGDKPHDRFGWGIGKEVGDVDGDGHDDYVIGAMESPDLVSYGYGYVRAYSGKSGDKIHEWIGPQLNAGYGERPTVIGDVDGDGFADVAVGAIFEWSTPDDYSGAAWVYSGKDGSTLWKNGGGPGDRYGSAFCPVGDVDGDGVLDFAVGAFGKQVGGVWHGGVEVWSVKNDKLLFSETGGVDDWFGASLADVGDLDGDGVHELLVGSLNDNWPAVPGEAHVYSLKSGSLLYTYAGLQDGDLYGFACAGLGDVDFDGVPDFAITAPTGQSAQPWTGHCYVYSGATGSQIWDLTSGVADDVFGFELMVHGDVAGDGRREWIVGAPGVAYGLPNQPGALHLFTASDLHATAQLYGAGWPGTNGVPSIGASNPPWLGEPIAIDLGNAYGQPTIALVLMGFGKATIPSSWDGTFLVAPPWIPFTFALPAAGLSLLEAVDPDAALAGVEVDVQFLHIDPGATDNIAFSRGLELILGGL